MANVTLNYLSGFNNYYNRQIKLPNSTLISDYEDWVVITTNPTNFNPNDGINTAIDVNYKELDDDVDLDYLIVSEDNNTVSSRWFVLDRQRNLSGQWHLSLRRDIISDYYQSVIESPVFIEKAHLYLDNALIFNKESDTSFNQIKYKEHLLKDETGCGWIVGYVDANFTDSITVTIPESGQAYPASPIDIATLQSWANADAVSLTDYWTIGYKGYVQGTVGAGKYWEIGCNRISYSAYEKTQPSIGSIESSILFYTSGGQTVNSTGSVLSEEVKARADEIKAAMTAYIQGQAQYKLIPDSDYNTLLNMDGGTFISGSTLFTIRVSHTETASHLVENVSSAQGSLYSVPYSALEAAGVSENFYQYSYQSGINAYISMNHLTVTIDTQAIPATSVTLSGTAKILSDAPYRMFCIPLGNPQTTLPDNAGTITPNPGGEQFASRLATEIAKALGTHLYDLQLLPYCPQRAAIELEDGTLSILGTEGTDYQLVKDGNNVVVSYLLWCDKSSFSISIEYNIDVPTTAIEFKVANETEFCRLTAPNYSASYQFVPTMNRGVNGFEVNCTYKPFQPYIQVNPKYNSITQGSLYGGDFDDQRGLVCGGDFSMAIVNDNWIQYQINNKSYADAFERQIDNMAITYSLQREQSKRAGQLNAMTSALSAGAAGGMVGGTLGGGMVGVGTGLATGILGGALSMYGLREDLKYADALQREAMSLAQDNFGFQLQNIQALPYTLGKVSAFSINNKIFPFIEFYTATEVEKEALRLKLKYNGMTVGTVGTMTDYITGNGDFVQCQLIRYIGDDMDYHEAAELAAELHKGVYI